MLLLGLDPGLRNTGWGVIEADANRLRHVANGVVRSGSGPLANRLLRLHQALTQIIGEYPLDGAAVEETFVNKNPISTLKLGQARGVVLLVAALHHLPVTEYAPNLVKKSVVGVGHAAKQQIHAMVGILLPGAGNPNQHAADALAVAICHAHHAATRARIAVADRKIAASGSAGR